MTKLYGQKALDACISKTLKDYSTIDVGDDQIELYFDDGSKLRLYHDQECCENVYIEDICGSFQDLIGFPLLVAEERTSDKEQGSYDVQMWTFYTFRSNGGSVDVRWNGSSNGYYSIDVTCEFTEGNK